MRNKIYRWVFYVVGMMMLALGIVLNSKSELGMAPVLSIMFCLSQIFDLNFSNMTLVYYVALVGAQFLIRWKGCHPIDLLQIPMSIVFTRFMSLFSALLVFDLQFFWQKLLVAAAAVVATGVGITMAVNMRIVPNPGEGIVQTISDKTGISLGMSKNLFDGGSALVAIIISLILTGKLIGVGIGTVINVLFVGRIVALCTWLFKDKMMRLAFGSSEKSA